MRIGRLALSAMLVASLAKPVSASPVKSDEEVVVLPVSAVLEAEGTWRIPAHVWVYEPAGSVANGLSSTLMRTLADQLGIDEAESKTALFTSRAKWFAVDNERRKQVTVEMGGQNWTLQRTGPNGHSTSDIVVKTTAAKEVNATLKVRLREGDNRRFSGSVTFIPPTGVSVISDIDDTIKISNVLDKKALLKNTFLEPYQTTSAMPTRYRELAAQGAYFHYVSASPWQLWPSLKPFMEEHYPAGTIAMRHFRLKDSNFSDFLLKPSVDFKLAAISNIINRYPQHRFILIGDSGECDPEIYGEIARKFPTQVERIMIRKVAGSDFGDGRIKTAIAGVPELQWELIGGGGNDPIRVKTCKH